MSYSRMDFAKMLKYGFSVSMLNASCRVFLFDHALNSPFKVETDGTLTLDRAWPEALRGLEVQALNQDMTTIRIILTHNDLPDTMLYTHLITELMAECDKNDRQPSIQINSVNKELVNDGKDVDFNIDFVIVTDQMTAEEAMNFIYKFRCETYKSDCYGDYLTKSVAMVDRFIDGLNKFTH